MFVVYLAILSSFKILIHILCLSNVETMHLSKVWLCVKIKQYKKTFRGQYYGCQQWRSSKSKDYCDIRHCTKFSNRSTFCKSH